MHHINSTRVAPGKDSSKTHHIFWQVIIAAFDGKTERTFRQLLSVADYSRPHPGTYSPFSNFMHAKEIIEYMD